jgi:hypothetical protein
LKPGALREKIFLALLALSYVDRTLEIRSPLRLPAKMKDHGSPMTLFVVISGATVLIFGLINIIYRLYFHPLKKVPGPVWSAASSLPSFYHNFIRKGQWYREVARLHEIYGEHPENYRPSYADMSKGPIVRFGPNEIHLSRPEHYETVYGNTSSFYKDPGFYAIMGMEEAMFCTVPNDLHRQRRSPLNPFFSRKAIVDSEFIVHDKAERLCRRIGKAAREKQPVNLTRGFRALSVDVVTDYSFNRTMGLLEDENFGAWFTDMLREAGPMFWIFQQFPIFATLLQSLPPSLAKRLSASFEAFDKLLSVRSCLLHIIGTLLIMTDDKSTGHRLEARHGNRCETG